MKVPSSKFQVPESQLVGWDESFLLSEEAWMLNDSATNYSASAKPQDLEERTARFGEAIIRFAKRISLGLGNDRLIGQLTGCGISVGANYCEASKCVRGSPGAVSRGEGTAFNIRKHASEMKFKISANVMTIESWNLEFPWNLGFGIWNFCL